MLAGKAVSFVFLSPTDPSPVRERIPSGIGDIKGKRIGPNGHPADLRRQERDGSPPKQVTFEQEPPNA
jgi:hypothetical protein